VGPGSIGIGWNPVAGATRYTLQESANGAGWVTLLSDGRTSVGVSRGNGSYAYRVQACNFVNCGAWSGFATVNVALPTSPRPLPRAATYKDGYTDDHVMANRSGTRLRASDENGITRNDTTQKLKLSDFKGVFRAEGRLDAKRLDRQFS